MDVYRPLYWSPWVWFVVAVGALISGPARAQGLGGFLSPGPLAEPHAELEGVTQCAKCHEPGKGLTAERCLACHEDVQTQVRTKQGFHADKGETCAKCHPDHRGRDFDLIRFSEQDFDHDATGFVLEGPHRLAECSACHETPGVWTGLRQACDACHDPVHGDGGKSASLLGSCEKCHEVVDDWEVASLAASVFDHTKDAQVDWILEGAHLEVACAECHTAEARFHPTDHAACTDCHDDPHRAPFSDRCESCHGVRSWSVAAFDHGQTPFALEGRHAEVSCRACHGDDVLRAKRHGTCADCHEDVHRGQFVAPGPDGAPAPRPCDSCHDLNVAAFEIARFDHEATPWPLRGSHATVGCAECHQEGPAATWVGVAHDDCDACHEDPHGARFEPTPCARCHAEEGWQVEDFDHDRTDFPLVGRHADVTCAQCHPDEQWSDRPHGSCLDCHRSDDPHGGSLGAETCVDCHAPTGWAERRFDHDTTAFALGARHGEVPCRDCHQDLARFAVDDADCTACHEGERPFAHYDGACESCHLAATWLPAGLGDQDHAITGFELEGRHSALPCESCHPTGHVFADADGDCVECHATDDPHRHQLGDACGDCHGPTSWARSRFRHFATGWPLRGAHRLVACDACHASGYLATPTDCAPCHAGQAGLDVPAHRSAFFLDCAECHQPYTWLAASFGH